MPDNEMTAELRQSLTDEGFNPEELAEFERNQCAWDSAFANDVETITAILAEKATKSLDDLKDRAPSFFYSANSPLSSSASAASAMNKLAHTGCKVMCQAALFGNARAAGQLARLAVMLTEALADTVEKGRIDSNFSEATKAIREVARWMPYWPILFYTGSKAERDLVLDLFEELELGQECPVQLIRRSGKGRKCSLGTPLNQFLWKKMAAMYKIRHRPRDFMKRHERAKAIVERNPDHPFFRAELALTQMPGALLCYSAERKVDEEESQILTRMLELDDLRSDNAKAWADEVIVPITWLTTPESRLEELFKSVGKTYSPGEFQSRARKEIRSKLISLSK